MIIPDDVKQILSNAISPRTHEELVEVVSRGNVLVVGRCSNTLFVGPPRQTVVQTCRLNSIEIDGQDVVADSGVPLPRLVSQLARHGLGGMEYLASVPGTVGGAIYSNAGRGIHFKQSISDFVVAVEYFDGFAIVRREVQAGDFGPRSSIFKRNPTWVVIRCWLRFPLQPSAVGLQKIKDRLALVRRTQDITFPNIGTIFFRNFVPEARTMIRCGGASWSRKTPGWIINAGGATASDVLALILDAQRTHIHRGLREPELEISLLGEPR